MLFGVGIYFNGFPEVADARKHIAARIAIEFIVGTFHKS